MKRISLFIVIGILFCPHVRALTPAIFDKMAFSVIDVARTRVGMLVATKRQNTFSSFENNGITLATGTIIGPKHALTSAHVFLDDTNTLFPDQKDCHMDLKLSNGQSIPIKSVTLHPHFDKRSHDLAILEFTRPYFGLEHYVSSTAIQARPVPENTFVQTGWHQKTQELAASPLAPFPKDAPKNISPMIQEVFDHYYGDEILFHSLVTPDEPLENLEESNARLHDRPEPGDSGSPLYVIKNNQVRLYGINSGVFDISIQKNAGLIFGMEEKTTSIGIWTMLSANYDWFSDALRSSFTLKTKGPEIRFQNVPFSDRLK